jgi:hypothetical protein
MGSYQNRYGKYSKSTLPKEKKTIRLQGSLEDSGVWYRCWHCGFINKDGRSSEGEYSGVNVEESGTHYWQDRDNGPAFINRMTNIWDDHTFISIDVFGGCSFCGCTSWKG